MSHYIIKNAIIINEEKDFNGDLYTRKQRIEKQIALSAYQQIFASKK